MVGKIMKWFLTGSGLFVGLSFVANVIQITSQVNETGTAHIVQQIVHWLASFLVWGWGTVLMIFLIGAALYVNLPTLSQSLQSLCQKQQSFHAYCRANAVLVSVWSLTAIMVVGLSVIVALVS